ncbi:hypothetical protein V6B08_10685 [Ferrovibrio sp. MS7]|uniref:hypothetical protein n=1 Tax=Ferrovibrio plantarum TaxID=3119164 RepID=UPI0031364ACD
MRSGGRLALAAACFCALLFSGPAPAWSREPVDQRDPRHLQSGPLDPALYDLKPAQYLPGLPPIPPRGPAQAKGLIIWNHGRDVAVEAMALAPPVIWELARQGWDVQTLQRHGTHDVLAVALRIVGAGLDAGRAQGYRRIVLAGQSVGAWIALGETARRDAAAVRPDAVLALAPAAFGTPASPMNWRQNDSRLRPIWEYFAGRQTALFTAFFAEDPYFEQSEPGVRGPFAKQRLGELGLPALVLDRPAPAVLHGHAAGMTLPFARRFAPCLVVMLDQGRPPPCEDGDRNAIATFGLTTPAALPSSPSDAFAGLWQGTSANGRYMLLELRPLGAGQQREALYGLGRSINNEAASSQPVPLVSEGRRQRWSQGNLSLDLSLEADGRLKFRRTETGQPPQDSWLRKLN